MPKHPKQTQKKPGKLAKQLSPIMKQLKTFTKTSNRQKLMLWDATINNLVEFNEMGVIDETS